MIMEDKENVGDMRSKLFILNEMKLKLNRLSEEYSQTMKYFKKN